MNFSDGGNAHRSVRFSSRAVRVSSALLLNAYGPHTGLFFSYGFPTKLSAGPYGSYDKKQFFYLLVCTLSVSVLMKQFSSRFVKKKRFYAK